MINIIVLIIVFSISFLFYSILAGFIHTAVSVLNIFCTDTYCRVTFLSYHLYDYFSSIRRRHGFHQQRLVHAACDCHSVEVGGDGDSMDELVS
jgi:hypothetical protein